ncbi:MAG: MDR family oxidoreductase [Paraburkholderia sp.]|uniref:acrylyl-CoA reductase (NADPH) n=1 Tax=Paraburkholderia sp. TaxID=1926495 RepID=UPI00397C031E
MFNAIVINKPGNHVAPAKLSLVDESAMSPGDVTIDVRYSTLNHKDALAITGWAPIVKRFPMVPGIDFAGTVADSDDVRYRRGDLVILNGWGVGETHWGGLAQKAQVKGDWLIPMPAGMTTRHAMSIGTAGYTAMLCVNALERAGIAPQAGPVLVTGANGGVGTFAIWLLSQRGYTVCASTGRPAEIEYLRALGASEIVERHELDQPGKPLQRERWVAAIDCVGSHTLANVCAGVCYGGVVAACGLAQGMDFPATVAPFILRGVSLIGIDSVYAPRDARVDAWNQLANEVPNSILARNTKEITLTEVCRFSSALLDGEIRGRLLVDVNR